MTQLMQAMDQSNLRARKTTQHPTTTSAIASARTGAIPGQESEGVLSHGAVRRDNLDQKTLYSAAESRLRDDGLTDCSAMSRHLRRSSLVDVHSCLQDGFPFILG